MQTLSPVVAIHLASALGAVVTGPIALWARKGSTQRPKLHRAFGYVWVTLMTVTAISALFIPAQVGRLVGDFGPIHALSIVTLAMLALSFWFLARGNITGHRKTMQNLYFGACVVAGAFTLAPGRFLGNLVWGQWLGLLPAGYTPPQGQPMLAQIAANTPLWVWALLAGLVALGLSQTRTRRASLARVTVLPLGLVAFSAFGLAHDFGSTPAALSAWLAAAALALVAINRRPVPAGTQYDSAQREFVLPGSWAPMVLILSIFLIKYAVGVSLGFNPGLRADTGFALAVAALSGLSSGLFAGRTVRLLRLARRPAFNHPAAAFNA